MNTKRVSKFLLCRRLFDSRRTSAAFQTGGISLDFKLVTGTLSGVFIQRAFLHVDDARTKLRASSLVRCFVCADSLVLRILLHGEKTNEKSRTFKLIPHRRSTCTMNPNQISCRFFICVLHSPLPILLHSFEI